MLTGKHLIAGQWTPGDTTFQSSPATGEALTFAVGTPAHVDAAATAAEAAFPSYSALTREDRAVFLERIASEIDARGPEITAIGTSESGLPAARLEGERGRTTGQLRLFAAHIRAGASNFPLAFSTAGGDTASALAAGCPVVVKGHSAHPGTGEIVAQAIDAAIKALGLHPGVFSLVQGGRRDVGESLVQHPLIKAVGFTGSLGGGRALFDLCARRPEPIPFFGELGSVNPMFLLPEAVKARGEAIAKGWAGSLTMGAGQFCTNPGIAVMIAGPETDALIAAATAAIGQIDGQTMLTDGIAQAYRDGQARIAGQKGVQALLSTESADRLARPNLYQVAAEDFAGNHTLTEEVFGPLGLVIKVRDAAQMIETAKGFEGQLTVTLHMDAGDTELAQSLMPIIERKAGRILANGFPTGVEVVDAQVHGGPYPASTNFGATSVGTLSIRRWLRPVAYQNLPDALLPPDLR